MTYIDTGTTGAKRATWRDLNPRRLLREIIEANPKASEKSWRDEFWAQITEGLPPLDETYVKPIVEYWLDNNIRSLVSEMDEPRQRKQQTRTEVERRKREIESLILLNLQMPNGKLLGECTGSECKRFGGWYVEIAKVVPAKKLVGDVLNETEIRKLWNKQR
jgi:hypothetical protein